jgi:CheY-specific phosphatase CheX
MEMSKLDQMVSDCAIEVLESMFFTSLAGDGASCENPDGPWISARLSFHGNPTGRFGVRTGLDTGRKIAASFLGIEEDALTEPQIGEVVCELANMLCGTVVSRLEEDSRFELAPPSIDPPEAGCPECPTARCAFELEEGRLAVWLELEKAG